MFNNLCVNPAYAGSTGLISTSLISRHQWVGIDGAPQTQSLSVHAPLKKQLGIGVNIIRDQAGPLNNILIQANCSYHLNLNDKSKLYFGLMTGLNSLNAKLTEVVDINFEDLTFQQNLNSFRPVFGTGLYFSHPNAYAGFSIPDIVETTFSDAINEFKHKRHFYLIGGYLLNVGDMMKLRPTAMLRYVDNSPIAAEVTMSLIYNDFLWFGIMYRHSGSAGALVAVQINPEIRVGYAYDYSLNSLKGHQGGSHEIMLNYDFNYNPIKLLSPRYF
jgi:type IX secretion system PorP/SprF family membrane protein